MSVLDDRTRDPGALLAVGLGGVLVVAAVLPYGVVEDGPVLCPFRALTGVECPACGMTRSWVLLAHGDLPGAVSMHPIGPFFFVLALVTLVTVLWRRQSGRWPVSPTFLTRTLVVLSVATGVFGVARWFGLVG